MYMYQAVSMQTLSIYTVYLSINIQGKLPVLLPAPLPICVPGLPLEPAPPYPGELSVLAFGFGGWYCNSDKNAIQTHEKC